ncbi:MAG: hypothetical protein WCJ61_06000 [Paludibacter sp.]
MKKLKLITAFMAVLLCSNLMFAAKPNALSVDSIINPMIDYLDNDVKLTNNQKVILKKNANDYALSLLTARGMNKSDDSYTSMKIATEKYNSVVDSILTSDQKTQKQLKNNDRNNEMNKNANQKK